MLPEIGATELLVIAAVALIVVGPKDLPLLMRRIGQFMARIRGMAAEFRASFDDMARQSELDDLRREVEAMRRGQVGDLSITDGGMSETASDIEKSLSDVGVQLHPPMSYQYAEPEPAPAPEPAKAPRKPRSAAANPKAASAKAAAKAPAKPRAKKPAARKVGE